MTNYQIYYDRLNAYYGKLYDDKDSDFVTNEDIYFRDIYCPFVVERYDPDNYKLHKIIHTRDIGERRECLKALDAIKKEFCEKRKKDFAYCDDLHSTTTTTTTLPPTTVVDNSINAVTIFGLLAVFIFSITSFLLLCYRVQRMQRQLNKFVDPMTGVTVEGGKTKDAESTTGTTTATKTTSTTTGTKAKKNKKKRNK